MATNPTVFVVDDDEAARHVVRRLAESVGYLVEEFASAQEFLRACDPARPGCLVLDVRLRGMSGLELQDELAARGVALPVIIVTGYADVRMAVRAIQAGAIDLIEKPFRGQALLDRIQQAIQLDARRRRRRAEHSSIHARLARLTPRDRQVLDLVVTGNTNREIAVRLGVSVRAVESHRARVMERMEADSMAALVKMIVTVRSEPADPANAY